MTPALASWLLAVPYVLTAVGFLFVAWAAGGSVYSLLARRNPADTRPWHFRAPGAGVFLLFVRIATGLAVISWLSAMAGVAGHFRLVVALPLVLLVVVAGVTVSLRYAPLHRPALFKDRLNAGHDWIEAARSEKVLAGVLLLVFCALLVNAVVGALVPDMNQDPMWYHLSVPQQWVFESRFGVYPDVMPSAYPLAVEALYALIFLIGGDAVMCALLSAFSGMMLFFVLLSGSFAGLAGVKGAAMRGWGTLTVLGLWVPLLAGYGLTAPVQPKNDMLTMLWGFSGVMLLWLPLLCCGALPSRGWWAVGGLLLGTACSAKPSLLSISFFAGLGAFIASIVAERRSNAGLPQKSLAGATICVLVALVAMAPWIYRGVTSHGLPLYPLGRSLFTVNPDFLPLLHAFDSINGFVSPSANAWAEMITRFPGRLWDAAQSGEKMIFLYIALALAGAIRATGFWRIYSIMLLAQLVMLVGMRGAAEVFRFFSPAYCLAAPLLAWLAAHVAPQLRAPLRNGLAAVCIALSFGSFALFQYRLAQFRTYDWQFRPVLATEDVNAYARHAEMGPLYLAYQHIRPDIQITERVLLLGTHYPYYLHRNTLWNDEAVDAGGLAEKWNAMSPADAEALLRKESIDTILYVGAQGAANEAPSPVGALLGSGRLQRITLLPKLQDQGWALYRVVGS